MSGGKDEVWVPIYCAPRGVQLLGVTKDGAMYLFELDEERDQMIYGYNRDVDYPDVLKYCRVLCMESPSKKVKDAMILESCDGM